MNKNMIQTPTMTESKYRNTGWPSIISGIVGILAYGFLFTAVTTRSSMAIPPSVYFMFRAHDVGVILQFLLMIPVVFGLHNLSQKQSPGMSQTTLATGIGALCFTILFLLLAFPKVLDDGLYMFPQGIFGVWLMVVNWRLSGLLPRGIRWFGMVVGFGLMLVGTFPVGYTIFVDTSPLQIPAIAPEDGPVNFTPANTILHQVLVIGSLMGVATLPIWSILLGVKLHRSGRKAEQPITKR